MLLYRKLVALFISLIWVTPAYASALSIPFSFSPATPITAGPFNANFAAISSWANGNVDNTNLSVGANIDLTKLNLTQQLPILRAASSICFGAGTTGDTVPRLAIDSNGNIQLGAGGSTAADILIKRSAVGKTAFRNLADTADTDITAKNANFSGNVTISGALINNTGTTINPSFGGDGSMGAGPSGAGTFPAIWQYNYTTISLGTSGFNYLLASHSVVNSTLTQTYVNPSCVIIQGENSGGQGSTASDPAQAGAGPGGGAPGVGSVATTAGGGGAGAGGAPGGYGASLGTALLRARGGGGGAGGGGTPIFQGGNGGAGSGAQSNSVGVSGGLGGGCVRFCSAGAFNLNNAARIIIAEGTAGVAFSGATGGGGGAGGGGCVYVGSLVSINTGTVNNSISVAGGAGGAAGSSSGGGGGGGGGGTIILQAPAISTSLTPASACIGGVGGTAPTANGGTGTNGYVLQSISTPNAPLISGLTDHHGFDRLHCLAIWKKLIDKQDTNKPIEITQHEMALACSDSIDQYARCMNDVLDTQCNLGVGEVPDTFPDCG